MNFLLRATQPAVPEVSTSVEPEDDSAVKPTPRPTTLEGLIAEESFPSNSTEHEANTNNNGDGVSSSLTEVPTSKSQAPVGKYTDVSEEDGWITIPYKDLPDNWTEIAEIQHLRPLDRSFVFPGEHIHILVCLSASKQETEIITPFRVAAVMSKNGKASQRKEHPIESLQETDPANPNGIVSSMPEKKFGQKAECNGKTVVAVNAVSQKDDISAPESLLRLEYHKQQTEHMLESFRNSNFFVRIAEADEQLWSKRNAPLSMLSEVVGGRSYPNGGSQRVPKSNVVSAVVDKGSFDGNKSGGMARETVRCHSLSNGDIVVLLEMNVGVNYLEDPVLEVIQFEKYNSAIETRNISSAANNDDPSRELLNWLLPLDRSLPPRSVSPPLNSSMSQKTVYPAPGSQMFSFGNFRSYSLSSLPQVSGPPSSASFSTATPVSELEDYDRFSKEQLKKSPDTGNGGLLSFRGIPLEPERFSAHCGLEGIYLPGKRWRRKLEIVQPVEIHSFAAECNTEDLLCVQIKNVSPSHLPDIVIFLDAITIVSEEASKGGPPLFLPIASIETGNGHSLPNLALRRGEEHSFILKLATISNRDHKVNSNMVPYSKTGSAASNAHMISSVGDGMMASFTASQFSIVASCRCNYTESKLFFKQATNWKPRIARIAKDLMISVAADSHSHQKPSSQNCRELQLPVKVLTLKATNLTSEDLTFTVLAPETASSPSVLSLSSTPKTSMNSSSGFSWDTSSAPIAIKTQNESFQAGKTSNFVEQTATMSDVISNNPGFSHLWLQSSVPLGCIPALSSASVKLELLPLTDGIITLDTLQIAVKEKGMTFKPEHSLKIHATSSISSGIL